MSIEQIIKRWLRLISLVKLNDTGRHHELAQKLGISSGTLYRDIKLINRIIKSNIFDGLDSIIAFDKGKNSYVLIARKNDL